MKTPFLRYSGITLALASLYLAGCATEEVKREQDHVFGAEYRPVIHREKGKMPSKILYIRPHGLSPEQDADFKRNFSASVAPSIVLVDATGPLVEESRPVPSEKELKAKATTLECEGILYVKLKDHRPYPPIRVIVEIILEDLTGEVLVQFTGDYDGQVVSVANAARRFYQSKLQRTSDPGKSMSILGSDSLFLRFAADNSAQTLNEAICPSISK